MGWRSKVSRGGEPVALAIFLNFFQDGSLKEVKASGGCHGIRKEFFVHAQSRFRTQLCRGIIDLKQYLCRYIGGSYEY
ncbi:hypothetical protein AMS59_00815 [Lysinibacillus sp. FJAT-14745]|nr:hypothetical protein AMS59_00815 [Lysinibacillus sp. FJAT-14745]